MLYLDPPHDVAASVVHVAPALVDFLACVVVAYTMFPLDRLNSTSKVESLHKVAQVAPASTVRKRPALVAASRILGFVGWMTSLRIVRFCPRVKLRPVALHVLPPLALFQ